MMTKNIKTLKTVAILTTALIYSNASNAWFWDSENDRKLRVTPEGQVVPASEPSLLERLTTYNEEMKPTYNPATQRIERPVVAQRYDGKSINTDTPTVKPAWYDRATTYNEEQRRPWNPYEVDTKNAPAQMYYDKAEAKKWNDHYGQEGLKPVPYMYGSASLVLRKEADASNLGLNDVGNLRNDIKKADARAVQMGGYGSIDNRAALNELSNNRSNFIAMAEPVNNVNIGSPKEDDLKVKTKIGNAKADWRDKLAVEVNMARPGDFDYNKKQNSNTVKPYAEQGRNNANNYAQQGGFNDGQVIAGNGSNMIQGNDYNYNAYASQGGYNQKVDNYTVETGDTLSQVSEKERVYGDWTLWPLIYDANRHQVNDPDLIMPGQNLDIPRNYNQMDEDDARYRAKHRQQPITLYDGQ